MKKRWRFAIFGAKHLHGDWVEDHDGRIGNRYCRRVGVDSKTKVATSLGT